VGVGEKVGVLAGVLVGEGWDVKVDVAWGVKVDVGVDVFVVVGVRDWGGSAVFCFAGAAWSGVTSLPKLSRRPTMQQARINKK